MAIGVEADVRVAAARACAGGLGRLFGLGDGVLDEAVRGGLVYRGLACVCECEKRE